MINIDTKWIAIIVAGFAVAMAAFISVKLYGNKQFNNGYSSAIANVKAQNLKKKGEIDAGVSEVDECDRLGRVWDSTRGVCN